MWIPLETLIRHPDRSLCLRTRDSDKTAPRAATMYRSFPSGRVKSHRGKRDDGNGKRSSVL